MLLYQFIPFFLGAHLNNNESWEYGPEYIFSGYLEMTTSLERDMGFDLATGVKFNLNCRPCEINVLRCHLSNSTISRLAPKKSRESDESSNDSDEPDFVDTPRDINIAKIPFEVKFNDRGIESLILEKTEPPTPSWTVNSIRLIVEQLGIGIDLSDEMRSTHISMENSTIGECHTDWLIIRRPIPEDKEKNSQFELSELENLGKFLDESIQIEKRRNVKDCLRCTQSFFTIRYTLGLLLRDVLTKLKTSDSKIFMSKYDFTSETINESDVYSQDRKKLGKVVDRISLILDSIIPAKKDLDDAFENPIDLDILFESSDY